MITKQWYVIHYDNIISMYGSSEGASIFPGKKQQVAEFDTEAEMLEYIEQNNLELPDEFDNEN